DHGTEQVRALRDHGAHQQATVRAAVDSEVIAVSVFLCDQVFAGSDEVVKNVLLFLQHAGAMPVFAEFGTAAQIGDGVNATVLHPEIHAAVESWRQRDVKTAVAVQQGWVLAILLDSLLSDYKHRDLRPVFRGVPNLLDVI